MPNCVSYVEQHEATIEAQTAAELDQQIKALRKVPSASDEKRRGRKPTRIDVAGCKLWPSLDGTKLRIEGLTEVQRAEIIEAIKSLLSLRNK